MSKKGLHTEHLTSEQIELYLSGNLSNEDMYAVERHLLNCDFCNEAMEGYENTDQSVNIDEELDELNSRLKTRITPAKKNNRKMLLRIAAIAIVLIVSGIFITNYFINDMERMQFSEKKKSLSNDTLEIKKLQSRKEIDSNKAQQGYAKIAKPETTENKNEPIEIEGNEDLIEDEEISSQGISQGTTQSYTNSSESYGIMEADEEELISYAAPLVEEDIVLLNEITIQESAMRKKSSSQAMVMKKASSEPINETMEEEATIEGIVNDEETKEAIPFVSVVNLDKDLGTLTDMEGKYKLEAEEGDEIVVSSIGYNSQSIEVADKQNVNVSMNAGIDLEEVVVSEISDSNPQPIIGYSAYKDYLKENIQIPQAAIEGNIKGKVVVRFNVDGTGILSDFIIVKSLGYGCDEEAIRLIKEGPAWKAAIKNGLTTSQEVKMKVNFK